MYNYSPSKASVVKSNKLYKDYFSKNEYEKDQMKVLYNLIVFGSMIYTQLCTEF